MTEAMEKDGGTMSRSKQAWADLGDEFEAIGQRFRRNYDEVTETAGRGTEKSQRSIERAVKAVTTAVQDTATVIGQSLRDPAIKEETEEAGARFLRAVGVTLAELGESLQRQADDEHGDTRA